MNIHRDIGVSELIRALRGLGYESVRHDGSHIRLTTTRDRTHHVKQAPHLPNSSGEIQAH